MGATPGDTRLATADDCQSFNFDIKILKISGSICKAGNLEIVAEVFGVEVAHSTADLSKGRFCQNAQVGKPVGVTYCFYMKGNCLCTSGEINGWFEQIAKWDEQILRF